jgi:TPR repeat protein
MPSKSWMLLHSKLAADKGLPEAQYHLGLLAERGRGVPRDFAEATKWYVRR